MNPKQYKWMRAAVIFAILMLFIALYLLWSIAVKPSDVEVRNYIGKSAYQVAVDNGFKGSETQWLASLKSEPVPGPKGDSVKGDKGDNAVSTHTNKVIEQQTILEKQIPINGRDGREVEFRTSPDTKDREWRYAGTRGWNVLIQYCEIKDTCEAEQ